MNQLFELVDVKTSDGIRCSGIAAFPKKPATVGVIWVHGLGSSALSMTSTTSALAQSSLDKGYAFAAFNNRGSGLVKNDWRYEGALLGSGFEKFTECIFDIDAAIRFMKKRGVKKVILVGHSTGANKIAYYASKKSNPAVKGIFFVGGLTDVKELDAKQKNLLTEATKIANKNQLAVLPYEKFSVFMNAQRFISLFTPGSVEDVFSYHGYTKDAWDVLRAIKLPVGIIIGSRDQFLSIPVKKYIKTLVDNLSNSKCLGYFTIKGADHFYRGQEKELVRILLWQTEEFLSL